MATQLVHWTSVPGSPLMQNRPRARDRKRTTFVLEHQTQTRAHRWTLKELTAEMHGLVYGMYGDMLLVQHSPLRCRQQRR